jgi:hypothetical protein
MGITYFCKSKFFTPLNTKVPKHPLFRGCSGTQALALFLKLSFFPAAGSLYPAVLTRFAGSAAVHIKDIVAAFRPAMLSPPMIASLAGVLFFIPKGGTNAMVFGKASFFFCVVCHVCTVLSSVCHTFLHFSSTGIPVSEIG